MISYSRTQNSAIEHYLISCLNQNQMSWCIRSWYDNDGICIRAMKFEVRFVVILTEFD